MTLLCKSNDLIQLNLRLHKSEMPRLQIVLFKRPVFSFVIFKVLKTHKFFMKQKTNGGKTRHQFKLNNYENLPMRQFYFPLATS